MISLCAGAFSNFYISRIARGNSPEFPSSGGEGVKKLDAWQGTDAAPFRLLSHLSDREGADSHF